MKSLSRILGVGLFLLLVVALWYLSEFWPWRTLCGEEGPFGLSWLSGLTDPVCPRDGLFGIEALDRRGGVVQRQLQAVGLGEFGLVVWGLLVFLILSLAQALWSRIARMGGEE